MGPKTPTSSYKTRFQLKFLSCFAGQKLLDNWIITVVGLPTPQVAHKSHWLVPETWWLPVLKIEINYIRTHQSRKPIKQSCPLEPIIELIVLLRPISLILPLNLHAGKKWRQPCSSAVKFYAHGLGSHMAICRSNHRHMCMHSKSPDGIEQCR